MGTGAKRPAPCRKHASKGDADQDAFHDHGDKAVFIGKRNRRADGQQHRITPHKGTVQQHIAHAQRNGAQHDERGSCGKQGDEQIDTLER